MIELGPGDSIGVGLAAMLTGAEVYVALDRVALARNPSNLAVFDAVVALLRERATIPETAEFPEVRPLLDDYSFPSSVLNEQRLAASMAPERVARLRAAVSGVGGPIRYVAPWDDATVLDPGTADLILSQAVLEHVADLDATYGAMARWIRPGGHISHQIDFRSHNTSLSWNGHWAYSERAWGLVAGRPPLINRQPLSEHLGALERAGFRVTTLSVECDLTGIDRMRLHQNWRSLSDDDLTTAGAFIQATQVSLRD